MEIETKQNSRIGQETLKLISTSNKEHNFEKVKSFIHLEVMITEKSEDNEEIQNRLIEGTHKIIIEALVCTSVNCRSIRLS